MNDNLQNAFVGTAVLMALIMWVILIIRMFRSGDADLFLLIFSVVGFFVISIGWLYLCYGVARIGQETYRAWQAYFA